MAASKGSPVFCKHFMRFGECNYEEEHGKPCKFSHPRLCKFNEGHLINGDDPCRFSAEKCKFFHRKSHKEPKRCHPVPSPEPEPEHNSVKKVVKVERVNTHDMSFDDIVSHSRNSVRKDIFDRLSTDNSLYYSVLLKSKLSISRVIQMITDNYKEPENHASTLASIHIILGELILQFPDDGI